MSMMGWVLGLTPAQISALRATPSLARKATSVAQDDRHRAHDRAHHDELMKRLSPEQRKQVDEAQAMLDASPGGKEWRAFLAQARELLAAYGPFEPAISLEKSWHILHYLFTGHAGRASAPGDLLLTGESVGEAGGYGPARLHGPTETRGFSRFLETQDLARLQARVDFEEMDRHGITYRPGNAAEHEMIRDEVGFYFPLLRDYVRNMADKGNGLLVWLS